MAVRPLEDPYLNPDTGVLSNRLNLTTQRQLDAAEADLTPIEIVDFIIEHAQSDMPFNLDMLRVIHWRLFRDIYEWAGEIRTSTISKGATKFCDPAFIEQEAERIFLELQTDIVLQPVTDKQHYIKRIAYYYSELNLLHPFREGNGRALSTLMSTLGHRAGTMIRLDKMDPQENLDASIYAVFHDESKLEAMFDRIIEFQSP